MSTISLSELEKDAGSFIDRVEAGEHFEVSRDGRVVAEIRPVQTTPTGLRPYGLCVGEFTVPDDFDDPLPDEVIREFEGR